MDPSHETHFFLGTNALGGFCFLQESLADPLSDETLYLLKGGPVSVKSLFLETAADELAAAGYSIGYMHSVFDPDLLDAIHIPALKTAFVDGTAPHGVCLPVHKCGTFIGKRRHH